MRRFSVVTQLWATIPNNVRLSTFAIMPYFLPIDWLIWSLMSSAWSKPELRAWTSVSITELLMLSNREYPFCTMFLRPVCSLSRIINPNWFHSPFPYRMMRLRLIRLSMCPIRCWLSWPLCRICLAWTFSLSISLLSQLGLIVGTRTLLVGIPLNVLVVRILLLIGPGPFVCHIISGICLPQSGRSSVSSSWRLFHISFYTHSF